MEFVDRALVRSALVAVALMGLLDTAIRSPLDPSKTVQIVLGATLALAVGMLAGSVHRAESRDANAAGPRQD